MNVANHCATSLYQLVKGIAQCIKSSMNKHGKERKMSINAANLGRQSKQQGSRHMTRHKETKKQSSFTTASSGSAVYSRDLATCQGCGNVITDLKIIDHIVPRRLCSSQEALNSSNLWCLCGKCHYRKTKIEQLISQQQNGDIILAHLSRDWWTKLLRERKGIK